MATASMSELTRTQKRDVGKETLKRLEARAASGPPEPALDMFIPLLGGVVGQLSINVDGKVAANAAREAELLRLETADSDVDTWLRHHESFVRNESNRRIGPNVALAKALYDAAFPNGIAHVDDYIPDENQLCREAIVVLRSPEHAATVAAIELPPSWTAKWEAALDESDSAFEALKNARAAKSAHVGDGRDAEVEFVDVMYRLRRYIDSRASRTDKIKQAENRELLLPLLDALKKLRTDKAARATRAAQAKVAEEGETEVS